MAGVGDRVTAGRAMVGPLAALNFCMYMIILGISGWALNRIMDLSPGAGGNEGGVASFTTGFGNRATLFFILFSLIAGVTGIASTLAGFMHTGLWRAESLATAAATALIAWLLTLLALGLACKEIHTTTGRDRKLKTLESFVIILGGTQLLYLIMLHGIMASRSSTHDPGYAGVAEPHMKAPGAAAAV